jgi:hypothetical protein
MLLLSSTPFFLSSFIQVPEFLSIIEHCIDNVLGPHGVLPGKFFNFKYDCGRPRETKQAQPFIRRGLAVIFYLSKVSSCEDPVGTEILLVVIFVTGGNLCILALSLLKRKMDNGLKSSCKSFVYIILHI